LEEKKDEEELKQIRDTNSNEKVGRLIDYLERLSSLRRNSIRDIDNYEKVLWMSDIPREKFCFTQAWGRDEEYEEDVWLEVKNWSEPELPAVPEQCKNWVYESTLRDKNSLPELLPIIEKQIQNPDWHEGLDDPETIPKIEGIEDYPDLKQIFEQYIKDKWLPWREIHNRLERVKNVYSDLFSFNQQQLKLGEQYELIFGFGFLIWQPPTGQRVRRHFIVANAFLEFDAKLAKFTVRPHTDGAKPRCEFDMLDIDDYPSDVNKIQKYFDSAKDNPWDKGCIEGVLKVFAHSLDEHGEYYDSLEIKGFNPQKKPIIVYAPALILRKRSEKGLAEVLKKIKEQINTTSKIPKNFAALAEIHPSNDSTTTDDQERNSAIFDGEIFFPNPSNDEQRCIIDKIRTSDVVVVQGPPGTGKSHTIANLICHLLAVGQRTLITAKTPRALKVLERFLPDELRPLCISLLGNGIEEHRSLESSVSGIMRKQEEWDEESAKCKVTELKEELKKLREEKSEIERRLRVIRESETYTKRIAEGTYIGTAAMIAEAVNLDRAKYDWFTDIVPLDEMCQISTYDLQNLLLLLRQFTPDKRNELELVWPEDLPSTDDYDNLVREENKVKEEKNEVIGYDERLANLLVKIDISVTENLIKLVSDFQKKVRELLILAESAGLWIKNALRDILSHNSHLWHERLRVTRDAIAALEAVVTVADNNKIEFPDDIDIKAIYEDALKLKEYIEKGGKLNWFSFPPKYVKEQLSNLKTVKINGKSCKPEYLSTLIDVLKVRIEFEKVWDFWKGCIEKIEGPYTLQMTAFKSLHDCLEKALMLEDLISKCHEIISQYPYISEPVWSDESQIEKMISSCRFALLYVREKNIYEKIKEIDDSFSCVLSKNNPHPVVNDFQSRNVLKLKECINKIQDLTKQRDELKKMDDEILRLRQLFPRFIDSIKKSYSETHWEDRIKHFNDAYHWAQARYWVDEYISQKDIPEIEIRAKQIESEIKNTITKLAELHAWLFCLSRLSEGHRLHMEAWQQSMVRLGKGTGKHAPYHRREAQRHLNECREAVPAWVMPLHRVFDTIQPVAGMFDVVIVDEASQCGFEALPLLYLGKKILIVGDNKQISPDAVGVVRDNVQRLREGFLYDFKLISFDVESSLFDYGKLLYRNKHITLREHFRCMPEIIRFSNDLCYSDTPLIPLRQYGQNRLTPLEHVFVSDGFRKGSGNRVINEPEADKIVERICAMCNDRCYDGKTIGIVVLQGEVQADLIENKLFYRLGAEEIYRRQLICGNPYSFQGDERDIILLSMVAANNERIGSLAKPEFERRFNVAASRARDQMILFHSVTCNDLSSNDLRRKLLEFFEDVKPRQIAGAGLTLSDLELRAAKGNRKIIKPPEPFDSWFEVDVCLEILRKRYAVYPQYKIASKRIDLVVEGGQARLAIECDGDRWHSGENFESDIQRQRQLERCGWEFFRIRGSAFYADKNKSLEKLWPMLKERGILPN
jgi:superfamily I DNA and/or RNA helicase/very-short-patch-repair endonuclease